MRRQTGSLFTSFVGSFLGLMRQRNLWDRHTRIGGKDYSKEQALVVGFDSFQGRTWAALTERWLREGRAWKSSRTIDLEQQLLEWFNPRLSALDLVSIDDDLIDKIVDELVLSERKPSTINRYLSLLRAMLNAATVWRWLRFAPKVRQVKDRAKRVRWLTFGEAKRLLAQLPPHLSDMAAFSLETGLRRGNVTGLTWTQVDLNRRVAWIHADQAKGKRAIPVPLSPTAVSILRNWILQHHEFVFVFRGRRIKQTNTKAWRLALDRAGIRNFRWHDLRHTWASWHAQNGTPRHILQELGGWSDERMVKNYAHLSVEHLAPHVDLLHQSLRQGSSPEGRIRRIRERSE